MRNFLSLSISFFVLLSLLSGTSASAQCPVQADVVLKTHTDISCFGANDGTITVDITDAATSEPFNFELFDLGGGSIVTLSVTETENKPNRSVVYSNVPPGTYAVLFFKAGCYFGAPLVIIEPPFGFVVIEPAQLSIASTVDPDCGSGNGQIDIVISGGTLPYSSIIWSGPTAIPNGTTSTAANLAAGVYTVTVTDANGCTFPQNINVPITTIADAGPPTALVCGPNTFNLSANAAGPGEIGTWSGVGVSFSDPNDPNATVTGLTVGANVLTWTIQDIAMVCLGNSDNITVTYSDVQMAGTPDVLLDCFGDTDGTGTFTVTGGVANFTYSVISNTAGATIVLPPVGPTTSVPFTNAGVGVVTLQVQDAAGCTSQTTITITQPTVLTAATSSTPVSCFGGNDGSITVTPAGGTAPYDFSIDGGGTYPILNAANHTFTTLTAGTYNLTVRDANNCVTAIIPVTITQPAVALSASTTQINVSCFGGNDGSITVTPAGGTAPYDFSIDGGGTYPILNAANHTFTTLTAGTYNLTVRDANNCVTAIIPVTITQPAVALSASTTQINVSCFGGNDGSITVTPAGGTAPYDFSIDGGGTYPILNAANHTFTTLTAGTYNLTVRDANNCVTAIIPVTITQPAVALSASTTQVNVSCFGGNDGSITVTPAGGTAPYDFSIDGGGTYPILNAANHTFTTLTAGTYNLTVRDANNCVTAIIPVTITQPAVALSASTTQVNVSCFGGNDGSITVTPAGGTAPYDFSIDGGGTYPILNAANHTFTTLTAGTYNLTVRDANNCVTAIIPVTITQPAVALSASTTQINVSCFGGNDGSITVTPAGGTAPYDFSIDGGGTYPILNAANHTFTTLTAGTYNLTVRDANNCVTAIIPVTITQPAVALSASTTQVNVSCFGGNDGSITVTPAGGTAPYDFSIDGGGTYPILNAANHTFTTLTAGTYNLTVRDANNCVTAIIPVTITQPAVALSASTTQINVSCFGGNDGSITVTPAGGTAPYDFSIDGGGTYPILNAANHTFTTLTAGTYNLTVRDANNCVTAIIPVTITQPAVALSASTTQVNVSCFGGNDGSITVTPAGGTAPYDFSIDGGGTYPILNAANHTFTTLTAGTYNLTVRDANNCVTAIIPVTITQPAVALSASTTQVNVSCFGGNDGSITVTPAGGTAPYDFSIDGGGTYPILNAANHTFTTLTAGTYNLTVRDANNCVTAIIPVTITQPAVALSASTTQVNVSCFGGNDGSITVTPAGGTAPYDFSIDGGGTYPILNAANHTFTTLTAGTYNLTVRDANNCVTAIIPVTITQPFALNASVTTITNILCNGGNTGAIDITVGGGTLPYGFLWSNGATTEDVTTLIAGVYSVTVTDANGCSGTLNGINVTEPLPIVISSATDIDATCAGVNDGSIQVNSVTGGTAPYQYSNDNGGSFQVSNLFANLLPGNYDVVARDADGCVSPAVVVTVGSALAFTPTATGTDATCSGVNDGVITVTAEGGGTGPYTYSSDNGATFGVNPMTGLAPGTYDVVVRDANGCLSNAVSVTINSGLVFTPTATATDATCSGLNDGTITVTAEGGGTGPYTYSSDNGVNFGANPMTGLAPGTFDVVVRDNNGCLSNAISVTVNSGLVFTPTAVPTDASCSGINDGSINVTAEGGGVGPYTYSSDNGATFGANPMTGLAAGTYDVVVRDNNGCLSNPVSVTVGSGVVFTPTVSTTAATCTGINDGVITITTENGGVGPYTYSSDSGVTFGANPITGLAPGSYDVVVRDSNGCLSTVVNVSVASGTTITFVASKTDASCLANDGSITVSSVLGGTGPYSFSINNGATFQLSNVFNPISSGNYNIVVRDANGCLSTSTPVTILIPGGCGGLNCFAFTVTSVEQRPSCTAQDDGQITFTVSGGTPNYIVTLTDSVGFSVSLPGAGPNFAFTNLSAADYFYIIQDQAGNICPLPYSLPVQTNVDADASGLVDASCFGQPTGQATLTVNSGGNSPFEYSLDGITWVSFTSPHTITDLPPNGAYSILVRDDASDACPDQVPVTINTINPQIDQPFTVTPATCNNNDGIITLSAPASGGAGGPYTFLIDGIPTAPVANEFTGLSGGNRTLSVIDNVGCQRDYSVPIIFPGFVNTSLPTISGPDCISNGTNGVIAFTILDVGSFEFAISTDASFVPSDPDYIATGGPNVIIPNLTNGDYFVWVRSLGSQCPTKLGPLTVIGVYGVSFLATAENEFCFGDGGSIVLSSIVGAPNIDYGLEINGTITNTIDFITSLNGFTEAGLAPGSYQVRLIQDQTALNGCTVSTAFQPFTIDGPNAALGITSATPTLSFPDQPTGSMQIVVQESGEEDYEVWLTSDEFNSDTLLAIRNPILFEAGFTNLAATDYVLHVKDALGCEVTQNVSIAIDPTVFVPNIFTPNNDGVNDEFYVRNLPTSGSKLIITNRWGTEVYSSGNYNPDNLWNGGDSPDGIYYYRLQIQGGKTYSGWVEIVRGVKP